MVDSTSRINESRINRNIVECKDPCKTGRMYVLYGINRNIVECKVDRGKYRAIIYVY